MSAHGPGRSLDGAEWCPDHERPEWEPCPARQAIPPQPPSVLVRLLRITRLVRR